MHSLQISDFSSSQFDFAAFLNSRLFQGAINESQLINELLGVVFSSARSSEELQRFNLFSSFSL